jgi:hypothetical protein
VHFLTRLQNAHCTDHLQGCQEIRTPDDAVEETGLLT